MNTHTHDAALPADDNIAEQAAEWIVLLTADDESERTRAKARFEAWKQADPRHAAAAVSMEEWLIRMRSVRSNTGGRTEPARRAIDAALEKNSALRRGKRWGAALVLLFALAWPAWLGLQAYPPGVLMADVRTATGESFSQTLADGTFISANAESALNIHYDTSRRRIELLRGEIFVDVAPDPLRPFWVETEHASIRALGTRFIVRHEDGYTLLTMLESKVQASPADGISSNSEAGQTISAGQRVRISADGMDVVEKINAHHVEMAWERHQLVVQDMPLAEVLDELDRHRPGRILYDRERIAGIEVSAVLPLDDTDRALRLLHSSFPHLRIRSLTAYLVMIDAP